MAVGSAKRSIIYSRVQTTRYIACGSQTRKSELGKPMEAAPDVPTAFEEQVQRLGLNEQTCATSEKLKQWCERNKRSLLHSGVVVEAVGNTGGSECQRLRKRSQIPITLIEGF